MKKYNVLLKSDNIDFVKLSSDLIDDYLIMVNDIEIQKKISTKKKTYTYKDEMSWIEEKIKSNSIIYSLIERKSNNFIGNVELMNITENDAELGISITSKYQNKHYGTETLKRIIEYSFHTLNLNQLNLVVFSNNYKAIHCYQKLGFIEYNRVNNIAIIDNETVDDIYMKLEKNTYF